MLAEPSSYHLRRRNQRTTGRQVTRRRPLSVTQKAGLDGRRAGGPDGLQSLTGPRSALVCARWLLLARRLCFEP